MQKAVEYFRGSVRVCVSGRYPERVINICAGNGIEFRDLERGENGEAFMTVRIEGYRRLREIAKNGSLTVRLVERSGMPFFLWRIRKRYALIAGLLLCVLGVCLSSLFIWQIEVTGNETVSTEKILANLKAVGVDIGSFRLTITPEYVSNEMLLKIPELSWLAVNINGSRAQVIVREEVAAPEIRDEKTPTLIYAEKPGIITKMTVLNGNRTVAVGDTVLEGECLVTGVMDSKSSGKWLVHADAEIWARTWYELSDSMPLTAEKKQYTGNTHTETALIIAGKRVNLYFSGGNKYENYDKITTYKTAEIFNGTILPFTVVKSVSSEYVPYEITMSEEEAVSILEARLLQRLNSAIGDGSVTEKDFSYVVEDGVLTVTLRAECLEEIGEMRPLTEAEKLEAEPTEKQQEE